MAEWGQGWLTKVRRKKGNVWLHHFYVTRNVDGRRVETTRTIGSVSKFPRKADAWAEAMRWNQVGISGRMTIAALIESYEKMELPHKAPSTQEQHKQTLRDYVRVRWGKTYVDEVRVLELKQWFMAIAEKKNLSSQSVQKIKQVFGRPRERIDCSEPKSRAGVQHSRYRHETQEQGDSGSAGNRVEDCHGLAPHVADSGSTCCRHGNAD